MKTIFTTTRKIRFGDTDPAGIVFYPRYFEMFVAVMEDFFEEVLHAPFRSLHLERHIAVPLASIQTDFLAPSRIGEQLVFTLTLHAAGRTSFTTGIEGTCDGTPRLRATLTTVFVDMQTGRPTPPPDDIARFFAETLA